MAVAVVSPSTSGVLVSVGGTARRKAHKYAGKQQDRADLVSKMTHDSEKRRIAPCSLILRTGTLFSNALDVLLMIPARANLSSKIRLRLYIWLSSYSRRSYGSTSIMATFEHALAKRHLFVKNGFHTMRRSSQVTTLTTDRLTLLRAPLIHPTPCEYPSRKVSRSVVYGAQPGR